MSGMCTGAGLRLGAVFCGFSLLILLLGGCTIPPSVVSTDPGDGASGVAINTKIAAVFDERMSPAQLTTNTFLLQYGTTPVGGTVTGVGDAAVFAPASDLLPNTAYTATITTGAESVSGDALPQDYVWSFTTGITRDTTPPTVASVAPAVDATDVMPTTSVTVNFSKAMDPTTLTTEAFILSQGTTSVAGTISSAGTTATFYPASPLAPFTLYTAAITAAAQDLAGNPLAQSFTWNFTTGAAPDVTPPTVTQVIPSDGSTGVAVNATVAATFSEAMTPSTISTATFLLARGSSPVSGTVTYTGTTALFTASTILVPSTTYTARITTGATDVVGNALARDVVWNFTTGPVPDTTIPFVVLISPLNGAADVLVTTPVTVTFSEAMDPSTLTTASFFLSTLDGSTLNGVVTYDVNNNTATFTPQGGLALDTFYTATVTTAVTDLGGNHLANVFAWSFTTSIASF